MIDYIIKNKKIVFFLLFLYWIILFVATSIPAQSMPATGVGDKFEHYGAYFGLAVILNIVLYAQSKYRILRDKSTLFTILIAAFYGIVDELHQLLVPGRKCDFYDWLADFLGVLTAIVLVKLILLKKPKTITT